MTCLLEPIFVRQLQKAAINYGKILWVTTVAPCFCVSSLQLLAKDDKGRFVTLGLYNFIPSHGNTADGQAAFPENTRLGIKEPYYKLSNSGVFILRVDNPCNLIIEPPEMELGGKTPDRLKDQGNKFFKEKMFERSAALYGQALAQTTDESLQLVLYSNRAAARLAQRRYDDALRDCECALSIDASSAKARYRKGQALFGLRRYTEAQGVYAALCQDAKNEVIPVDKAYEVQVEKAKAAIECSTNGKYDLMTFPFDPEKQLETDVAEYFGPIAVRMCSDASKGRGLFLTKHVSAGDILFVERAQSICFGDPQAWLLSFDNEDKTMRQASQHGLNQDIVLLVNQNPRANALISYLTTGQENDKTSLPILDIDMLRPGAPDLPLVQQLSAYTIKHIVKMNAFGCHSCTQPSASVRKSILHVMNHPIHNDVTGERREINVAPTTELMEALTYQDTLEPHALAGLLSRMSKQDLNRKDMSSGMTALHITVLQGNEFGCRAVLKAGADPNAKDDLGLTPLHYAVAEYFNMSIAKALVKHGACVNEQSKRGFTPLHGAVIKKRGEAITWLLQHGADPYIQDFVDSRSPSHFACASTALIDAFTAGGHDPSAIMDGTGLWVVASFMNHSQIHNTRRRFIGRMMFVIADVDLREGTELTTTYGNEEKLGHWKIK